MDTHRAATEELEACDGDPVCWPEGEGWELLSPEELLERDCPACEWLHALYDEWMAWFADPQTGKLADPFWLELAFKAMSLEQEFAFFQWSASETSVWEYELIALVRAERARFAEQQQQEQARQTREEALSRQRDN